MTILILTLHEKFAVLSQDTIISDPSQVPSTPVFGITNDADAQRASALVGDGTPPSDLFGMGQSSKISVVPHLGMIAGYIGHLHHALQWDAFLRNAQGFDLTTLDMRDLTRQWFVEAGSDQHFKAFHAGWSAAVRSVRGFLYRADNAWKPVELADGHCLYPACDPDDAEFDTLQSLADLARDGDGVEAFHLAVAKNIHRAFLRGRYVKGAIIGGQLHTARIDEAGITVKVAHVFDCGD